MKTKIASLLVVVYIVFMFAGCSANKSASVETEAVYLGVENYGAEETNKEHRDEFMYRFEIDGVEASFQLMNGAKDEEGRYDYPLQNRLKEGYTYRVTIEDGTVIAVSEAEAASQAEYLPRVEGEPGVRTVKNFLKTALEPVGTTLYIYGGGWDWQDEAAAVQARTLGVSPDWVCFFDSQDENYTYKEPDGDPAKANPATSYYPYGGYNEYYYAGLDCSGYLGWALYNVMESENGADGYVGSGMVKGMAEKGWGEWTQDVKMPDGKNGYEMKPGDVMGIKGHVWISLGTCADGSIVIAHSTPSLSRSGQPGGGVQISAIGYEKNCEAYQLAEKYMSEQYAKWFERYPIYLCDPEVYFAVEGEKTGRFTWSVEGAQACLTDPEHMRDMRPEEVLAELFSSE